MQEPINLAINACMNGPLIMIKYRKKSMIKVPYKKTTIKNWYRV